MSKPSSFYEPPSKPKSTMTQYQHILLAIDYSDTNLFVARKARAIADQHQARLSIIHVLDNIPMPDTQYGSIILLNEDSSNALLENEKTKLRKIAEQLMVKDDDQWLIWGVPKQEIVEIARKEQVDLIVVGSHGRHGLALLLGSTANSILHYAACDVLAVRLQT
jgi:universal stress protein A